MARRGITLEIVLETSAAMLDETGLPDLSMAQLAQRLGIALPSLYSHVRNVAHLREEIALAVTDELCRAMGQAIQGRAGHDAMFALGQAYRAYAVTHPGRYAMAMLARPPLEPSRHIAAAVRCAQVISGALRGYGIPESAQIDAARALRASLHGFTSIEGQAGFTVPQDLDHSFEMLLEGLDRAFTAWPRSSQTSK